MKRPLAPGFHPVAAGHLATIVTFLELSRPVEIEAAPPWPNADLCRWHGVDRDEYRALFRQIGERWLWSSRLTMADNMLRKILEEPRIEIFRLLRAEQPVGLLELDFRTEGECEIAFFGLTPDAVGQGLGRWFMAQALDAAWRDGIERVWLHTCTMDHPSALRFYMSCGFKAFAREVEIMPDPRLSGHLDAAQSGQLPIL